MTLSVRLPRKCYDIKIDEPNNEIFKRHDLYRIKNRFIVYRMELVEFYYPYNKKLIIFVLTQLRNTYAHTTDASILLFMENERFHCYEQGV